VHDPTVPQLDQVIHRLSYPTVPESYTSAMAAQDTAVHEIDVLRRLLDDEIVSAQVVTPRATSKRFEHLKDPQIMYFETANGVRIDLEVFVNCQYGYDRGRLRHRVPRVDRLRRGRRRAHRSLRVGQLRRHRHHRRRRPLPGVRRHRRHRRHEAPTRRLRRHRMKIALDPYMFRALPIAATTSCRSSCTPGRTTRASHS